MALVLKGTTVKEPTLRALRSMGVSLANWFPENGRREPYQSWLDAHVGLYDVFFCFDSELLERQNEFPNTRLVWLPFGIDPRAFDVSVSDDDRERYTCDVVFVGACYPERVRTLSALKHLDLRIFGWKGWERTELADRYHGPLNVRQSAKAYRCAKVCLNVNLEPPVAGVNVKTFEIAAAGGFQLTDFRDDLPKLFEEGKDVAVFRSREELLGQVRRYLNNDAARVAVAQAGHERLVRDHTMRARIRQIALQMHS
jgi:spore maturation protein CgeB